MEKHSKSPCELLNMIIYYGETIHKWELRIKNPSLDSISRNFTLLCIEKYKTKLETAENELRMLESNP